MELIETSLKDCFVIKNKVFGDERGFFLESFNKKKLEDVGISFEVKQVNFAKSQKNVLRGLHYQIKPYSQAKLVGVISGAVTDVVVDLRKDSPSFLKHFKYSIEDPSTLIYIPEGFAHGYLTTQDETLFYYAVNNFYKPDHERGVLYCDKTLNIDWGNDENTIISPKDLNQPELNV